MGCEAVGGTFCPKAQSGISTVERGAFSRPPQYFGQMTLDAWSDFNAITRTLGAGCDAAVTQAAEGGLEAG
jgi:hypothetical protein